MTDPALRREGPPEPSVYERPTLLTIGILLTVIRSVGIALFATLFGTLGIGLGGLALFTSQPDRLLPLISVALGAGLLIVLGIVLYYAAVVVACVGAWRGSRGWTWALLVFCALGLVHSGPLGLTINGLTLFGCVQALGAGSGLARQPGL